MLTECEVSSITESYVELGIITHMSVELLLLEGAVEIVVYSVVTIACLWEFTVSCGVNIWYLTSVLVSCWLKGFLTKNTVALSISHICILFTMYS